jgi:integrase
MNNMKISSYKEILSILHEQYGDYVNSKIRNTPPDYIKMFREHILSSQPIHSIVELIGITRVFHIGFFRFPDDFVTYILFKAAQFTENRVRLVQNAFYETVFGIPTSSFGSGKKRAGSASNKIHTLYLDLLWAIIADEIKIQNTVFPTLNNDAMNLTSNSWTLFWMKGTSLQSGTYDFTEIKSCFFREAFKLYLKECRWKQRRSFRSENIIHLAARSLNFFSDHENIRFPSQVTSAHAQRLLLHLTLRAKSFKGTRLKRSSIHAHFKILRRMWGYLSFKSNELPSQPKILSNPFLSVSFRNLGQTYENAKFIPDSVCEAIKSNLQSIPDDFARLFLVQMGTGLSAKDAILIEKGSVFFDKDIKGYLLSYIRYKTATSKMFKNQDVRSPIAIMNEEALEAIRTQELETVDLRKFADTNFIFIRRHSHSSRINSISDHGYVEAIRRIIRLNNICDSDGSLWHFNSHQCRKTVAVNLITSGAELHTVQMQLGHESIRTTQNFYAEHQRAQIAKFNTKFFKNRFESQIGQRQLSEFSKEEREILFRDFRLSLRNVELGLCTHHPKDGVCPNRKDIFQCAKCFLLCTGRKYQPKWEASLDDFTLEVSEYERVLSQYGFSPDEFKTDPEFMGLSNRLDRIARVLKCIKSS